MKNFLKKGLSLILALTLVATAIFVHIPVFAQSDKAADIHPFYRYIDYSKYVVDAPYNSWLDEKSGTPYWTQKTDDSSADGNAYMRYSSVGILVGSYWEGNHTLAPSHTGSTNDIILPAATTFRATLRVRAIDLSNAPNGLQPFVIYGSKISSANSGNSQSQKYVVTNKNSYIKAEYTDWTEISFVFTTPAEYQVGGSETYNKCYIGFYPGSEVAYSYDIDSLELAAINSADYRIVDFKDYVPKLSTNSWGPMADRNTNPTTLWTSVVKDSSALGGACLNFNGYKVTDGSGKIGLEDWYGHFNHVLSNDGTVSTSGDMTVLNNIVLPTSTTYRFKIRIRLNTVSGNTKLYTTFSNNRNNAKEQMVIAENLQVGDWTEYSQIFTTPETYTYPNFYYGVTNKAAGDLNYDIDYVILEKVNTVSINFDANGGIFGESTTATEEQVIGDAPEARTVITAPDTRSALAGWSASADSKELITEITEDMAGTTIYAVWEKDPHLGGYNNESLNISFNGYNVSSSSSFSANGTYYWNVITNEESAQDGNIIRFKILTGKEGNWHGNYAMALSTDGTPSVLPNGVTYKATLRIRTQGGVPIAGVQPFIAYSDRVGRGYQSSYATESFFKLYSDGLLKDTGGEWSEISFNFTTPEEYLTTSGGLLFNKCFFGFYASGLTTDFCYDIDTITLQPVSNTNFYIDTDANGEYELYSSVSGAPGSELTLPSATETKEVYNTDGTGYIETYTFENWFSDEDCTKEAILKFGNFDVNLYCKANITASSTDGQVGFAGFDTYTEQNEGMSTDKDKSVISTDEAFTGKASMKTELLAGESAAFELRNTYPFEAKNGKTYRITLNYKTDSEVTLGVGIGDAGAVPNTAYALSSQTVSAKDSWQTISFLMNADHSKQLARGYAPAVVISSDNDATVYVDNVTISAVTDAVGAHSFVNEDTEDIRFMMSYNCGGDNTVVIEGKEYAVSEHGVLVTGADNKTHLTLENVGKNGVLKVSQTDTSKHFNRNAATYTTVYSVLIEDLPVDDDYNMSAKGYLKLSNGEVYYSDLVISSAKDSDDKYAHTFKVSELIGKDEYVSYNETTDTYVFRGGRDSKDADWSNSFFLCLPAGTVISSEHSFRVDTYSDTLYWKAGAASATSYTLPVTRYVKLEITGGDFSDINIDVPPEYRADVYSGSRAYLYDTLIKHSIDAAAEQVNALTDAINYIFITDLHTGAYVVKSGTEYESVSALTSRENCLKAQIKAIVDLANSSDIDFIAVGGDIVNGYETPMDPYYQEALAAGEVSNVREFVISQIQDVLDGLKESTKPVFILRGNHDDNHMQGSYYTPNGYTPSVVPAEVLSNRDWNEGVIKEYLPDNIVRDPEYLDPYTNEEVSAYYYYDIVKNGKNTRVICLDTFDHRYEYNEDGEISVLTSANGSTGTIGYNKYQLNWLVNVALKDYGGEVIFLSHTGIDSSTSSGTHNGTQLREILTAYQHKSAYKNDSLGIDVDYSNRGEGSIIAFQYGHTHAQNKTYTEDADIWQINTSCAKLGTYGTEYECNFDIVSATDKVVYRYNIGSTGSDDKLIYPDLP